MQIRYILIYFLIVLFSYLLLAGLTTRSDGILYYAMSESIANHHLSLEDEIYLEAHLYNKSVGLPYSEKLKLANPYYPGFTVIYYPILKIADAIRGFDYIKFNDTLYSAGSRILFRKIFCLWCANLFFLFLSFIILHLLLRKHLQLNDKSSFLVLLILFLSTPWIYYSTYDFFFLHNLEIFVASAFLFYWIRGTYNSKLYYFLCGILLCIFVSIRVVNVTVYILLILYSFINSGLPGTRVWSIMKAVIWFALGTVPMFSFLAYYNYQIFGSFHSMGYPSSLLIWAMPIKEAILAFLSRIFYYYIHPARGLLFWQPIMILSIVGIIKYYDNKKIRILIIASLALFTLILCQYLAWWAGNCFGQRYFLVLIPICAIGLGACLKRMKSLFYPISAILTLYSLILLFLYLGNGNRGSGEQFTPYTLVQTVIQNPGYVLDSFKINTVKSPFSPLQWVVKKLFEPRPEKVFINHTGSIDTLKINLAPVLNNHRIKFVVQAYTGSKKLYPQQFLFSLWSNDILIKEDAGLLELNHFGFPAPYTSFLLNGENVPVKAFWINYNNLLNNTNVLFMIIGVVDVETGHLLLYYEIKNENKYNLSAHAFMKKSLMYDANNVLYSNYRVKSLDDNNFIALFWQSESNEPFCIETFRLMKEQETKIPKGINPLSRRYFKGLLWILAEKPLSFQ